jgi:hypothetical protein
MRPATTRKDLEQAPACGSRELRRSSPYMHNVGAEQGDVIDRLVRHSAEGAGNMRG